MNIASTSTDALRNKYFEHPSDRLERVLRRIDTGTTAYEIVLGLQSDGLSVAECKEIVALVPEMSAWS